MATTSKNEFWSKSRQSDTAIEQFSKIYYNKMDKKRQHIHKMYTTDAVITWNGNIINGIDDIKKFFEDLPSSEHKVDSFDGHPLHDSQGSSKLTILATVCGSVKFEMTKARIFTHSFIITSDEDVWKIVAETFRYHE